MKKNKWSCDTQKVLKKNVHLYGELSIFTIQQLLIWSRNFHLWSPDLHVHFHKNMQWKSRQKVCKLLTITFTCKPEHVLHDTKNVGKYNIFCGVHKLSNIYEPPSTPKFKVPEGCNEERSKLGTHKSGVTCEPHHYLALIAWCMWTDKHFCM
jgi:hypothetical protein